MHDSFSNPLLGDPYFYRVIHEILSILSKKTFASSVALVILSPEPVEGSKMHRLPPSADRGNVRSETPKGFARAVFEANQ